MNFARFPMKLLALITLVVCGPSLHAQTYSKLLSANPDHPDQVVAAIQRYTYAQDLKFLEDNYSEYHQTGNVIDELGIELIYGLAPPKESASLTIDCEIKQNDLIDKESAMLSIYHLLLSNQCFQGNTEMQGKIVASVKSQLLLTKNDNTIPAGKEGNSPGQKRFDIARYGGNILTLLNDDAGLDIQLTDASYIKDLSRQDKWDDENPNHFEDLAQQYAAEAKARGIYGDNQLLRAAFYRLCFLRKQKGVPLSPQHPLIDLGDH